MADEVERRTLSESAAQAARQCDEDAGAMGRHHAALSGQFPDLDAGRSGHLPPEQGQGGRASRPPTSNAARRATAIPTCRRPIVDYDRQSARIFPQGGDHCPRRADPRLRPLQPAVRSGAGAAAPADREGQGEQEAELINNAEYGLLASAAPSQRISTRKGPADPGRSRRTPDQGVEGAELLPRPSARHRRLRPRMHPPRRAAADRHAVRHAVHHLARRSAGAVGQGQDRAERTGSRRARSCSSAPARRSRAWSACSSRAFPAKSRRASRCASWASTARRSPPT